MPSFEFQGFVPTVYPYLRDANDKPLGTTSAALGKRPWNCSAIGTMDCAVAPQPCRKTNRWLVRCSGVGAKRKTRPEDMPPDC